MWVLTRVSPSRFLQTVKGYTAREANRLLDAGLVAHAAGYAWSSPTRGDRSDATV